MKQNEAPLLTIPINCANVLVSKQPKEKHKWRIQTITRSMTLRRRHAKPHGIPQNTSQIQIGWWYLPSHTPVEGRRCWRPLEAVSVQQGTGYRLLQSCNRMARSTSILWKTPLHWVDWTPYHEKGGPTKAWKILEGIWNLGVDSLIPIC